MQTSFTHLKLSSSVKYMAESKPTRTRRRQAHAKWRQVFHQFEPQHPTPFTLSDVRDIVTRDKFEISTDGLRVKLARYVKSGYLLKVGRAKYRFTNKGFHFFGLLEKQENRKDEFMLLQ